MSLPSEALAQKPDSLNIPDDPEHIASQEQDVFDPTLTLGGHIEAALLITDRLQKTMGAVALKNEIISILGKAAENNLEKPLPEQKDATIDDQPLGIVYAGLLKCIATAGGEVTSANDYTRTIFHSVFDELAANKDESGQKDLAFDTERMAMTMRMLYKDNADLILDSRDEFIRQFQTSVILPTAKKIQST